MGLDGRRRSRLRSVDTYVRNTNVRARKFFVMSEYVSNVKTYTGQKTIDCVLSKQEEIVVYAIYIEERLEMKDMENRNVVVVYRNCM